MDFDAIANALALRFDPVNVTPPTGYDNIRVSTANMAEFLPPQPCVMVFADSGTFETGNGDQQGAHDWKVRFYYSQGTDLAREQVACRKWATVLTDQLRTSVSLSGTVVRATVDAYQFGVLHYAGEDYVGFELTVGIATALGWAASG